MLSKDVESTGLDHQHSARPFFLSTCDDEGNQCWWEADVDPLTRMPQWSAQDLREYEEYCNRHERWVYQSGKFDLHMESAIGVRHPENVWGRIDDTLIAGHILASNHPHDLTTMAKEYLGIDIKPYEDALEEAVKECRKIVQQAKLTVRRREGRLESSRPPQKDGRSIRNQTPAQIRALSQEQEWNRTHAPLVKWRIAQEDMEGFPSSTGEQVWRQDYWIPKALAKHFNHWDGLTRVISGGQNGVDQAGLRAALKCGIPTGGTAPKGYRTLDGYCIELAGYGLVEHMSSDYPPRTYDNVKNAQATIQLFTDPTSPGEILTAKAVAYYSSPSLRIDLRKELRVENVVDWVKRGGYKILNIAGNSERTSPGIGKKAEEFLTEVFRKLLPHPWHTVLRDYANADTAVTMALWKTQEHEIKKRGLWSNYRKQMELIPILYDMEHRGVTVSKIQLDRMVCEYERESHRLGDQCVRIASQYTVHNSHDGTETAYNLELPDNGVNASLRTFLTDVLQLPPVYNPKAKTDAPTLNKDALEHYQQTLEEGSVGHTFVCSLLDKRQIDTALSFMAAYVKYGRLVGNDVRWLILNPSYKPTGTGTTRLSSYSPNAQQISKKKRFNLRRAFGPAEGREWWSLDAANIELRLPAYESGEQDLINLFEQSDEPPYYGSEHILNFSIVYPDIWEDAVSKVGVNHAAEYVKDEYKSSWYRRCKNGDFAIQFGAIERANGMGTADRAFGRPGSHARLKQRFSKKEALNQKWIKYADQHGYVETMPDRTVDATKGYPLLCTRTAFGGVLPTVPLSYRVQGTAGIWMKHGMIRVQDQLNEWNKEGDWYGRICLTVHDELVFDFPRREHPKRNPKRSNLWRIRVIQKEMERGGMLLVPSVPTKVSVSYHASNWAEEETI